MVRRLRQPHLCALQQEGDKSSGLAGIISGGVSTLIWELVLKSPKGIKSALITVPLSFLMIFLVSFLTRNGEAVPIEEIYVDEKPAAPAKAK